MKRARVVSDRLKLLEPQPWIGFPSLDFDGFEATGRSLSVKPLQRRGVVWEELNVALFGNDFAADFQEQVKTRAAASL
jgi:hypothetical protein